jgi:hypothetical protein
MVWIVVIPAVLHFSDVRGDSAPYEPSLTSQPKAGMPQVNSLPLKPGYASFYCCCIAVLTRCCQIMHWD